MIFISNQMKVFCLTFVDSYNRVIKWRNTHRDPKTNQKINPRTVNVNNVIIPWDEWYKSYKTVSKEKIGKFTFLQMLDSYNRVVRWRNTHIDPKTKKKQNPKTVRVNTTTLTWSQWKKHYEVFKLITVLFNITDNIENQHDKDIQNEKTNEITAVYHFNQQNIPKWGEVCCAPVSSLICASHYDVVNPDNFQSKTMGLINAMQTNSTGTGPKEMVSGFNKFFTTLKMEELNFTEENIKKSIQKSIPLVANVLTDSTIGYKGKFGHYIALTGYKNGKVGVSDPHGFNIGRGYRYWYPYSVIKKVRDNNGKKLGTAPRPLWSVKRR